MFLDFIYNLLSDLDNQLFTRQQLEAIILPEAEKEHPLADFLNRHQPAIRVGIEGEAA